MESINKIFVSIAVNMIHVYRTCISPFLKPSCRHTPTCSEFTIEALQKHGVLIGSYLAFKRLLRCRPGGTQGYDPVPGKDGLKK